MAGIDSFNPLFYSQSAAALEAAKKNKKEEEQKKTGKVIEVMPKLNKVVVEGVNVATKHQAPRRQGQEGGIIKVETPIYASKVQLVCPKCNKSTRVGVKVYEDGKKDRMCKKCGETF